MLNWSPAVYQSSLPSVSVLNIEHNGLIWRESGRYKGHNINHSLTHSLQSLSRVQLFATPRTAARQAYLSITNSWSPPKPMSIELVMPSNHLILCHPLLLLHSIFSSIRVFPSESALRIRWPKYWSFSFNIRPGPMNTQDWSPLGWTGWISL